MVTEHTVCALPEGHLNYRHYAIQIQRRNDGTWLLHHKGMYLDEGAAEVDPENAWTPDRAAATRYADEQEALAVARFWADGIEINGITVEQALTGSWR